MIEFLQNLKETIPTAAWWWIGVLSVLTVVSSMVVLPLMVVKMADDYFLEEHRDPSKSLARNHPVLRILGLIAKNVLGYILIITGLIMFVTPGQGILTLLMGLVLINFPGKRDLELKIVAIPAVRRSLNWIRKKANKEPLILPEIEMGKKEDAKVSSDPLPELD